MKIILQLSSNTFLICSTDEMYKSTKIEMTKDPSLSNSLFSLQSFDSVRINDFWHQ